MSKPDECNHATAGRKPELEALLHDIERGGEEAIENFAGFLTLALGQPVSLKDVQDAYFLKSNGTTLKKTLNAKLKGHAPGAVAKKILEQCEREEAKARQEAGGTAAEESDSDVEEPIKRQTKSRNVPKATSVSETSIEVFRDWDKNLIIEWMLNNMPEEDIRQCIEGARVSSGRTSGQSATATISAGAGAGSGGGGGGVRETKDGRTGLSSIEECYDGIYVWGEDRRDYAVFFWDYAGALETPTSNNHWWGPYTVNKNELEKVAREYCEYSMAIDNASAGRQPKTATQRRENYPKDSDGIPDWLNADDIINEDWDAGEFVQEYDENCYYRRWFDEEGNKLDNPECNVAYIRNEPVGSRFGQSFVGAQGTVGTVNAGDNMWGINPAPGVPYGETLNYQEPNFCGLYNQIPVKRKYPGPTGGSCKFGKRKTTRRKTTRRKTTRRKTTKRKTTKRKTTKRKTTKRKTTKRKTTKRKTTRRKTTRRKTDNTPAASAKSLPVRTTRTGRDGKRYIVVIRASGKAWKKVDRSNVKGRRKSPTISASTQKVGTKKRGNDGNMWVIKTARSSTGRRYRVWRRL